MMSEAHNQAAARFKVIGVGGIGCEVISQIVTTRAPTPPNIEYIAMDTDAQDLEMACVPVRIQLGGHLLHGLDSGTDPGMGRQAAEESKVQIRQSVRGAEILFIVAAMGGGTGAGSAPVIAEIASQMGILTIGMVILPFSFEGTHRMNIAQQGVGEMGKQVDSLVTVHQDSAATLFDGKRSVREVLHVSRDLIAQGIDMITIPVYTPCLINLNMADISSILKGSGLAKMAVGCASGKDRSAQATSDALANLTLSLLEKKPKAAIFSTTGNSSLTLFEVNEAAKIIRDEIHPDANIIFSTYLDLNLGEEMKVTLLVTKFSGQEKSRVNRFENYRSITTDPTVGQKKSGMRD